MAEPLAGDALQLLEDAAHLLRRQPLATLAWHWAGSVPLALGALLFWSDLVLPGLSHARCALDALALAVLYGWMNCCRAVFAARLRQGSPPVRRAGTLVVTQVFLGATKLAAMPLAALATVPLAATVAFYRGAAALAGREDLDAAGLMTKARQCAGFRMRRNWIALAVLALLFLLVAINLTVTLAMLPHLVRILTGYESEFSRSGLYFMANSTFWLAALALSWVAFDPFVQAVYSLHCFQAESSRTGDDLRAALRRVGPAVPVVAALIVASLLAAPAARAVSPEALERSVQRAAQAPEYEWSRPAQPAPHQAWIVAVTDRVIAASRSALHAIGDGFRRLLRWIFGPREISSAPAGGALPGLSLPLGLWLLIALVVAAGGLAAMRFRASGGAVAFGSGGGAPFAPRLDSGDLDPLQLPEESWIEMAERSLREGNRRGALRALYLASLAWLGRREYIAVHAGKTNREYEQELRRRTRPAPEIRALFANNIAAFERAWYGMRDPADEDVAGFRRSMERIQAALEPAP